MGERAKGGERWVTLGQVAELVDGEVVGNPRREITRVVPLEEAGPETLGFLADRRYLSALNEEPGAPLLVSAALAGELGDRDAVVVPDAHAALPTLLGYLHPPAEVAPGIDPTAVLGAGVRLGREVHLGAYVVVEEGAELGDRVRVGPHSVIGRGASVGEDSVLHPHVVIYPEAQVGRRVILHAGVRIGSDGFGYVVAEGGFRKVPQVGRCVVQDDVEIGANSCVDRGSIGDTVIGRGSKLDNLVHIAHNVRMGASCALAAMVGIAGSTRIGNGVVFGGQAGASGHATIGDGVRVAAKSAVVGEIGPGETVAGFPARDFRTHMKGTALMLRLPELLKRIRVLERKVGVAAEEATADG